jgi:hypothetical protein
VAHCTSLVFLDIHLTLFGTIDELCTPVLRALPSSLRSLRLRPYYTQSTPLGYRDLGETLVKVLRKEWPGVVRLQTVVP